MKYYNPYEFFNRSFIPGWLEVRSDVSPGAKLLFARLQRFYLEDGLLKQDIEVISESLGMDTRSVKRYLKELGQLELIDSEVNAIGEICDYRFSPFIETPNHNG